MLYQICILLYTPQTCHSQLSQNATLTSNLGQQNGDINRVAKAPSLIPPRKMHAFKFFWFVKILALFSENETMQK